MGIESSIENIKKDLKQYKTFTEYILHLNTSIKNDLSSALKKSKKIIEITDYPEPTKNDDIYSCLIQYAMISKVSGGHIKIDNNVWILLFSFKKHSLKKLLLIIELINNKLLKQKVDIDSFKEYVYNYCKNEFVDIIINDLKIEQKKKERRNLIENDNFYINYEPVSENKKYKGEYLLQYMAIFGKKYRTDKNFISKLCEIIKYIDYQEIDYTFQQLFFFSDFPYIFGSDYNRFIFNFLSQINSIDQFIYFINFFDFNNHQKNRIDDEVLGFYKIFVVNMNNFYLFDENEFSELLLFLINLLKKNNIDKTQDILKELEIMFNNNEVINILTDILNKLNNYSKSSDFFKICIINYFLSQYKQNKNFDYLCEIVDKIHKNDILNLMFNKIIDFNISFEEFYSPDNNDTIDLIYKITTTKFYQNEEYVNINKIQTIKNFVNTYTYKIKTNDITFEEGSIINSLNDQQIKQRFIIFYQGNVVGCNSKVRFFRNKIQEFLKFNTKLKEVYNFLNTFYKEKMSQRIKDYQEKLNKFLTVKLNDNLFLEEDEKFDLFYNLSKKYNIFINSKSFIGLFELEKKKKKRKNSKYI